MLLAGDVIDPFAGIRADVAFDALSDHWKTNFESKYSNQQNSAAAAIQPQPWDRLNGAMRHRAPFFRAARA